MPRRLVPDFTPPSKTVGKPLGWPGWTLMTTVCQYCRVELCFQCETPKDDENCCCLGTYGRVTLGSMLVGSTNQTDDEELGVNQDGSLKKSRAGRPILDGNEMRNPVSAGRRRAAKIAQIPMGYVCEWALLEFAGGGPVPIVGCAGNTASDLHHGPDKSTLNNEVGINLHRICDSCHNRWHELNDPHYGERPANNLDYLPTGEWEPHDRISRADSATIFASDRWWTSPRSTRPPYRSWVIRDRRTPADAKSE